MSQSHILGFPRIGKDRLLKKAVEAYWRGEISQTELQNKASEIKKTNWQIQKEAGLDFVTVGDFSLYDHVLDTSAAFGVLPPRFAKSDTTRTETIDLDTIFCMARGIAPNKSEKAACAMKKWFNTNYHYIVPELKLNQRFHLSTDSLFKEIDEAKREGHNVKPVLLGPLTFLWSCKYSENDDSNNKENANKLELLPALIEVYNQVLDQFRARKITWFQCDEPILVLDLPQKWKNAYINAYQQLNFADLKCLLTTYFGTITPNFDVISKLPVHGLHIDLCSAKEDLKTLFSNWPQHKILSLGIVNGRNVWRNDFQQSLDLVLPIKEKWRENCWLSSSCSLLHSPRDLDDEEGLHPDIKGRFAFAKQKVREIAILTQIIRACEKDGKNDGKEKFRNELLENKSALDRYQQIKDIIDPAVKDRLQQLNKASAKRKNDYQKRAIIQKNALKLPPLPTTTIGSFPQTDEIRKIRQSYKLKLIDKSTYIDLIKSQIKEVVRLQEEIGIDVLVHGEYERNDMVEYFGELLNGFIFTTNGWVQSYGSRCVKPPIIYGDVSRKRPMTIEWVSYAQSLTHLPVKGMLTGPITILSWSFVRDDQPVSDTALQIALVIADEVKDLERTGARIIQIDEPAFREALPLRKSEWQAYFDWAIFAFHVASGCVSDKTQIHTHMCYSEFNDIIEAIALLDADVITIESSRSSMELLKSFATFSYPNEIGPGVYDIHSPIVPTSDEMVKCLEQALQYIPLQKLWINPDCGLKTRKPDEVISSLSNMIEAAKIIRAKYYDKHYE
jgi:5-methyltetrahydropteroyltriglutamate--homocysteine methyltransferase